MKISRLQTKIGTGWKRMFCAAAVFLCVMNAAPSAYTLSAGNYTVTAHPSYRHPVTGVIEDPGQNEGIGQGMTESMLDSQGMLEVDSSGRLFLTVRYHLMQYVTNVGFQTESGGKWSDLSFTVVQEQEESSDFRMQIPSLDTVVRGTAYIAPMGRDVVYYFTVSDPKSSGETSIPPTSEPQAPAAGQTAPAEQAQTPDEEQPAEEEPGAQGETDLVSGDSATESSANGEIAAAGKSGATAEEILKNAQGAEEVVVTPTGNTVSTSGLRTLSATDSANKTGMIVMLTISGMLVLEALVYLLYTKAGRRNPSRNLSSGSPESAKKNISQQAAEEKTVEENNGEEQEWD